VHAQRVQLEELELEALEWIAHASLGLGATELGAAQRAARELVTRSPFRETGHRFSWRRSPAAATSRRPCASTTICASCCATSSAPAPAAELQDLHQRLLAGGSGPAERAGGPPGGDGGAPAVALPRQLAPGEGSAFVARRRELEVLHAAWRATRAGRRRLVFVGGEPGIGKTRLAKEFARTAHRDGTVLYAACQEEALLPYQPLVEALRGAGLDWAQVAGTPGAGDLALLVPELPARADPAPGDAELRRYLLFEAVSALLDGRVAGPAGARHRRPPLGRPGHARPPAPRRPRPPRGRPAHRRHLPRRRGGRRPPLAGLLADSRRDRVAERLTLEGPAGGRPGHAHRRARRPRRAGRPVATVHEHTDGNPFFVEEVLRHLIELACSTSGAGAGPPR
jgi:hypothetical protein